MSFVALLGVVSISESRGETRVDSKGDGTLAVRTANLKISKLLNKKVAPGSKAETELASQVTTSVRSFLDVSELGERALQDHWAKLTDENKQQFLTLLRELIESKYIDGLRANLKYEVQYLSETKQGEHLLVATQIRAERRGRPYTIQVDYRLRREGRGWRAFDVVTDGVGLVENYRAQFNKLIAKIGFDGLLGRMRAKQKKKR